jgi:hypothetical protein
MPRSCSVYYAPLPGVWVMQVVFYLRQISSVLLYKPRVVVLSGNNRKLERMLIFLCNRVYTHGTCLSLEIGYTLRYFTIPLTLSLPNKESILPLTPDTYESTMWTLTFIDSTQASTKKRLVTIWTP